MQSIGNRIKLALPRFTALLAGAALVGILAAHPAEAVLFELTSDHCTGGCLGGLANAGTIEVTETGTAGTIHFKLTLQPGFTMINTGFDGSIGFNLAGDPTVVYSNPVPSTGFTPVGGAFGANIAVQNLTQWDGFGSFEYAVETTAKGGGSGLPGPIEFDLTATGLDVGDLQKNATGQFFAVDVFSGTTGKTGLVDASGIVPEPTTLLLVGTALFGTGLLGRRRFFSRKEITV